ncbi:MAG: type II secretion system F family protein [Planctomycetota bacterium]
MSSTIESTSNALQFGAEPQQEEQGGFADRIFQNISLGSRRANKRQLLIVFRQLSLLVETGIDVAEALELASATCRNESLSVCLQDVYEDVNRGNSLSRAIEAQKAILGSEIASSIQAGEASGRLVEVLRQIANRLESDLEMQSQIRGAMAYPAVLCTASVGVVATLIWFVLPQFEKSFLTMGVDPPFLTHLLLSTASFIRENWPMVLVGLFTGLGGLAAAAVNSMVKVLLSNVVFHLPFFGTPIRNLETGRLFVSMGHLLNNGVSLLDSLDLLKNATNYGPIRKLTNTWEKDVLEGRGLTHSLDDYEFLPDGADAMLIMAERTGKLENVLTTAGSYYQEEGSQGLKTILKLSEPIIIICLGLFVGTVVVSVLLPILDVQTSVG